MKKKSQFPFEINSVFYIVRQKTEIVYAFLVEGVVTLRGSTMPWPRENEELSVFDRPWGMMEKYQRKGERELVTGH